MHFLVKVQDKSPILYANTIWEHLFMEPGKNEVHTLNFQKYAGVKEMG